MVCEMQFGLLAMKKHEPLQELHLGCVLGFAEALLVQSVELLARELGEVRLEPAGKNLLVEGLCLLGAEPVWVLVAARDRGKLRPQREGHEFRIQRHPFVLTRRGPGEQRAVRQREGTHAGFDAVAVSHHGLAVFEHVAIEFGLVERCELVSAEVAVLLAVPRHQNRAFDAHLGQRPEIGLLQLCHTSRETLALEREICQRDSRHETPPNWRTRHEPVAG
jgi:hypothetical protein